MLEAKLVKIVSVWPKAFRLRKRKNESEIILVMVNSPYSDGGAVGYTRPKN